MKNLQELASAASLQNAIESSTKHSKTTSNSRLSNLTVFESTIIRSDKVSETAQLDFALCLLASCADSFHQSQVIELLELVDCKRKTVAKHVYDKRAIYFDYITVDKTEKIFRVVNRSFFQELMKISEFQRQLHTFAAKFFELIDFSNVSFEIAHLENIDFEQAYTMNSEFVAKQKKVATKKRANSKK